MLSKQISDIGSTSLPTNPTLNSRPGTYCWIRTSSHCSSCSASRFLRLRRLAAAGVRHADELEGANDEILVLRVAVEPFTEVEDDVGLPGLGDPGEVPQPDGEEAHLEPLLLEAVADILGALGHLRHVLLVPVGTARIIEDDCLHARASWRSDFPLIRRQAMSATVRSRSS